MDKQKSLNSQGKGLLLVLILQYALGMAVTSFVKFPNNKSEGQLWTFAGRQLPLVFHIILGLLLLVGSVVLLVRAHKQKNRTWIIAAGVSAAAILLADLGGSKFIPTQSGVYSYLMAVSFLVAFVSYGWGIYSNK